VQLPFISKLKRLHPIVGYSGHERGTAISLAAVALGAKIIERHITFDRNQEGPDHMASLDPKAFETMVNGIRQVEAALIFDGGTKKVSQGELLNRENLAKSIVASEQISTGDVFSKQNLKVASPGQGVAPYYLTKLLGKKATRDIQKNGFLFMSDVQGKQSQQKRKYSFELKWGIPVRHHDFKSFKKQISPDLFEFHLSYRDLSLDHAEFLEETECSRLVIHAPELFEHGELLNLASGDKSYRERSIANMQRVVDTATDISVFFPKADATLIVANVGGFSADAPVDTRTRKRLYDRFYASRDKIDWKNTRLIPQNMAPFPWHFGGQRYQNIFMMPEELSDHAARHDLQLCLDLAHLKMTCTHFGLNFLSALKFLLPHTSHIHIADAAGVNGEGVELDEGDIPWVQAWRLINESRDASFIPEIWQGHKDGGAGFWQALDFLESL